MKTLISLLLFTFCISLCATTHIVDNTSQIEGVFQSLQEAIDQASEGDTIYVKGTFMTYQDGDGDRTNLTKRLVLIGDGAFKTEGNTVNEGEYTAINLLVIRPEASGSVIRGFFIDNMWFAQDGTDETVFADISFYENEIDDMAVIAFAGTVSGLKMVNNLIYTGDGGFDWASTTGLDLQNNFVHLRKNFRPTGENTLKNNIILVNTSSERTEYGTDGGGNSLFEREWEVENTRLENNVIFMAENGPTIDDRLAFKASNVQLINNLALNDTDVRDLLESGNVNNTVTNLNTESDPFMNNDGITLGVFPFLDFTTSTVDYRLKDGSAGKSAGTDGKDIGLYGGSHPWPDGPNHRYEIGTPNIIPIIELLESNKTVVKPGEGLKVRIKATSNN